jgi:predicted nucleic acid-binding protein
MRKGNRLSALRFEAALPELERYWESLYAHAVTDRLIEASSAAARDHALRAYDALHLATITAFQEVRQLTLACWDRELRDAARKRSIPLLPERL